MVETTLGFGFLKRIIIDQHFLARSRQNRLTSAVLDRPHLIGVGVDEGTAILVNDDESFKVLGASTVMVIDARQSEISVNNGNYRARNLKVDLLGHGQEYIP
jgi:cyanophycinase